MRITIWLLVWFLTFGGGARDFDGTDDEIFDSSVAGIDTDAMSYAQWVRDEDAATDMNFQTGSDKSSGNSAWNANVLSTGEIRNQYRWSTTFGRWDSTSTPAVTNAWQHICATYDRSSDANDGQIWADGVKETVSEVDMPVGTAKTGVDVIVIGENVGGGADFNGQITFTSFYGGREFVDYECKELMFKPESIPETRDVLLLFDDLEDTSGNGHTFTNSNSTSIDDGPPVMFGGGLPL